MEFSESTNNSEKVFSKPIQFSDRHHTVLTLRLAGSIKRAMPGEELSKEKPSLEEVLKYADGQLDYQLSRRGRDIPLEQQEEVRQDACMRIIEKYSEIDPERGWKAFVQFHCFGAVMDYARAGNGYEETAIAIAEATKKRKEQAEAELAKKSGDDQGVEEEKESPVPLSARVNLIDKESGDELDVGEIAGIFGVHSVFEEERIFQVKNEWGEIDEISIRPKWRLVSHMAAVDDNVHLFAKLLLGFTQTEQAEDFGVVRVRLSQRIREFWERLDSPEYYGNRWTEQTIFAFGLSDYFGMAEIDNGAGWEFPPVNLLSPLSISEMHFRMESMDFGKPVERVLKPNLSGESPNHRTLASSDTGSAECQLMLWDILSGGQK